MNFVNFFNIISKISIAITLLLTVNIVANSQTKKSEVANPLHFQKIESIKKISVCKNTLKKCGMKVLVEADLAGFGGPDHIKFKEETFVFSKGVQIYLFSITGLEDDSVSGERLRVAFLKTSQGYKFVQIGKQSQCARGAQAGKWTKELCQ